MKSGRDSDDFNTPHEMLVRASFLVCLATFTGGLLVTVAGAGTHDLRLLALGIGMLAVAALTRRWLGRQRFEEADAALHEFTQTRARPDDADAAELVRLLREWEALERHRGSPRFDPWAIQAVRHDIRVMVEENPALEGLFRQLRPAA